MARYIGAQYSATRNQGYNESVTLINAGSSCQTADSQWELNLECKNCGDKAYTQSFLFTSYLQPADDVSGDAEVSLRRLIC